MIRILIADDHALFRAGLKQLLDKTSDIRIVDDASNGGEVMARISKAQYDLILLDISMPGGGIELAKQIKAFKPDQKVLIVSIHPEEQYAVRAFRAGASGYLPKESTPEELTEAIRKVMNEGTYVSPSLGKELIARLSKKFQSARHEVLSDRELQVLLMIASGKTVQEIADELYLSVSTINTYRVRILKKMNLQNDVELAHYAIQHQLLT